MARSLQVSPQYIEKVKLTLKRNGYPSQKKFAEHINPSLSTVKNFLKGEPVDFENFVEICEKLGLDWKQISNLDSQEKLFANLPQDNPSIACSAYDEETWVKRGELSCQLSEKLRGQLRVLIITGITGQGKTALAERLASFELRGDWQQYKCVNFDDRDMRDFVSAADALLAQLGEEVTADDRANADGLLNSLVQKLRNYCYLVQMDSLEFLLKGKGDEDAARNEFENERWWEFFNRLLAGGECQSRLILTSQDLPTQFKSCKSRRFWHEERLTGLDENEQIELFQKLFQRDEKEISPESEAADYLKRMGKAYEGHPLVIEVIAGEILTQPFNGNVVAYWNKYRQEFEAIEAAIGHQELQLQVQDRVRKSLERLQQDVPSAFALLLRSSVYRRSVPKAFWLEMLWSLTEEQKISAIATLKLRYLVFEESATGTSKYQLRQHNLIRSVAYELLEQTDKRSAHLMAAYIWRTAYRSDPDAPKLEQVRGYLEPFHHLCKVGDWERASKILSIRLNTPTKNQLHIQLGIWGYHQERIELYNRLVAKLHPREDALFLGNLGNAYLSLGNYPQAIEYLEQYLTTVRNRGDSAGEAEAKALGNLGIAYKSIGDYDRAINCHKQHRTIAKAIGDPAGEGIALGNLGVVYHCLEKFIRAKSCHSKHLAIAQTIGDNEGKGKAHGNLGNTLIELKEYSKAVENLQAGLEIFRYISACSDEAIILYNLTRLHHKLGDRVLALECCDRALSIATDLGIPLAKECQELKEKLLSEEA
ncbi:MULTISPECIES: tetratricopeptide repeat protein [Cyanophyceae]|uniref:tetratricopeptide repeat protein n=1 Tax=Cyanophyceae TaxID=3028117 RepID=UPI001688DE02|nr:tetratricopeptide repeat protein [Trichocoleus sp. FACHB-40]MBD2005806.1 tetratricopeptide repeat protein [Trichocoleus sp. FACHB-40]